MGEKFHQLTFTDRLKIEALLKADVGVPVIADTIGVNRSTIYRELKRGRYTHLNSNWTTEERYSPDIAEKKYQERLHAKGPGLKIGADHEYAAYLEYKVRVGKYSPGAVLGEIKKNGLSFKTTISKTTFYRYISDGVFLTITNQDLPIKSKKKPHHRKVRPARPPKGTSIEKRPESVLLREEFGHWEMDCVVGKKKTKKTLLVLTERKTRYEIICLMQDHTADSVVKALDKMERKMGKTMFAKVFKTITVDNGSEFSDTEGITKNKRTIARTKLYYCHPYSSYERGSNENNNRLVRRYYPKGSDFTNVPQNEIQKLAKWINDYPREIFGYYSAKEMFDRCLLGEQIA